MREINVLCILLIAIITLFFPQRCGGMQSRGNSVIDQKKAVEQCSKFATTLEGFFPLVDRNYWIKAGRENAFQENISLSAYRYYMAQHLYARLALIRVAKGLAGRDEQKYANHVQSVAPAIPYGIFTYLNSIGDIEVFDGDKNLQQFFEYTFLTWPNRNGTFGRVDSETHWMYMAFPAPAVVAQAIQEDLRYTMNFSSDAEWQLSEDLTPRPDELYPGSPTANLLGWKPAVTLTLSQRQKLQMCGISHKKFDVINSQFQFNPKIMEVVHEYFKASPQATFNVQKWYKKKPGNVGTLEQLAWMEREIEVQPFCRTFAFIERDVMGMLHPLQFNTEYLNKLSLIMSFRVKKYAAAVNDWAIYDWQDYEGVPMSWVKTRNFVFDFGDIGSSSGTEIMFSGERDGVRIEFLEKSYKGYPMYH